MLKLLSINASTIFADGDVLEVEYLDEVQHPARGAFLEFELEDHEILGQRFHVWGKAGRAPALLGDAEFTGAIVAAASDFAVKGDPEFLLHGRLPNLPDIGDIDGPARADSVGELPEIRIDILSALPMGQVWCLESKVGSASRRTGFAAHPRG
jgi:hypothetical protein